MCLTIGEVESFLKLGILNAKRDHFFSEVVPVGPHTQTWPEAACVSGDPSDDLSAFAKTY